MTVTVDGTEIEERYRKVADGVEIERNGVVLLGFGARGGFGE